VTGRREREARAALAAAVEPGTPGVSRAVAEHGPDAVLAALREGRWEGSARSALRQRALGTRGDAVLESTRRAGLRFICPGDPDWPAGLDTLDLVEAKDRIAGAPLGLWTSGAADLAAVAERSVAVVGARAATAYGTQVAADIAAGLGDRGWTVVSGGAYGIDAAAHRGALAVASTTVAVLACGADVAYPRGNAGLLARVCAEGAAVAELPPGSHPTRSRFLARNRLIAGLTSGTVVVEAAARSGALSTLRWAHHLGRHGMAVPGPVTSALSVGTHHALRSETVLVTGAGDVLDLVGRLVLDAAPAPRGPDRPWDGLPPTRLAVLEALPSRGARGVEEVSRRSGVPEADVRVELSELQLVRLADAVPDGWRLGPVVRAARAADRQEARAAAEAADGDPRHTDRGA
jgi:DNA processing protein